MTRYPVATNGMPLVRWGADEAPPQRARARRAPRFHGPHGPSRSRLAGIPEVAAGFLLLVAWILLWTFFLDAVVQPAGRMLRVMPAEHPSLVSPGAASAAGAPAPPAPAEATR